MKYFYALVLPFLLFFSCDTPPKMERVNQAATRLEKEKQPQKTTTIIANPEDLMKAYFSALKNRDHKQLKAYLKYPKNQFYLKELTPITDWEIVEIAELSSQDADTFELKPNPIKGDYLLKIKQYTVDDYKKTSYLVEYIIREEQRVYQLINRLEHPQARTLFLELTRDGITTLEELKIISERPNAYLLEAAPHFWIAVDAKAEIIDQIRAEKGSQLRLNGPEIMLGDSLYAIWNNQQQFERKDNSENHSNGENVF